MSRTTGGGGAESEDEGQYELRESKSSWKRNLSLLKREVSYRSFGARRDREGPSGSRWQRFIIHPENWYTMQALFLSSSTSLCACVRVRLCLSGARALSRGLGRPTPPVD